jgi:hypothetical protein
MKEVEPQDGSFVPTNHVCWGKIKIKNKNKNNKNKKSKNNPCIEVMSSHPNGVLITIGILLSQCPMKPPDRVLRRRSGKVSVFDR